MAGSAGPIPSRIERTAVLGIGGLGHLAVQYAKTAGFEIIAVSHFPDKDKMIRDLGVDEIAATEKPFCGGRRRCDPHYFQLGQVNGG